MRHVMMVVAAVGLLPAAAAVTRLPMKPGFYAEVPSSCAAAAKSYDGGVMVTAGELEFGDGSTPILSVTKGAGNTYKMVRQYEDEGGRKHRIATTVRILSVTSFEANFTGRAARYNFCGAGKPKGWGL